MRVSNDTAETFVAVCLVVAAWCGCIIGWLLAIYL